MGGKSSVPVKETARVVIARSKLQAEQAATTAVATPASSTSASASAAVVAAKASHKMEDFMDPAILKEMSGWAGSLKSEVDAHALSLRSSAASKSMATVIRFNEEKELTDRFGKLRKEVSGKLTEEQLQAIFTRALTQQQADTAALAREFQVTDKAVSLLLQAARAPRLVAKSNSANKTNLNELVLAV